VLAQGSGCLPATKNPNIDRAKRLLPEFAVVTVEKYGVHPGDAPKDPMGDCSATFYAHHTVSQRVADYGRVLAETSVAAWWDGRLVLLGGSEGGAAVSMLAPQVRPTAVIILSTAPGRSFRKGFKLMVPPEVAAQADSEFAKIESDPLSAKTWGGNSYRWWADVLDHDFTADVLLVNAPILLVHGERDKSASVQDARQVRDEFSRAGRCNLTYWEFAGYDHQMQDASGASHIDEVMQRIASWLAERVGTRQSGDECSGQDRASRPSR
jgi:pimeloyl-ACP methyl ester carboxylesterase